MATSRFLTVSQIGEMVEGYQPGDSAEAQEAFRRMFERDKQYLREIGIPVETGTDSAFSDEVGYRIRRGDYALPDISLDPDEFAALALAASLWSSTALADPAASALRKLAAGGARFDAAHVPGPDGIVPGPGGITGQGGLVGPGDIGGPVGFSPRVDTAEPAFDACLTAVQAGRAVRFPYRKSGDVDATDRHVRPWGVLSWRGRWYLAGHDVHRDAPRVFRLSRMTGSVRLVGPAGAFTVPDDVDLRAMVSSMAPPEHNRTARLRVRQGRGHALRRYARPVAEDRSDRTHHDLLEIDYADTGQMARWIVGYGPDVLVLGPADLRAEVIRRIRATLEVTACDVTGRPSTTARVGTAPDRLPPPAPFAPIGPP